MAKIYDLYVDKKLMIDMMIYGTAMKRERRKYNPLRYILGRYKRIDPRKLYLIEKGVK